MTGFGRNDVQSSSWYVRIEAKTINHRYLDVFLRVSRPYSAVEEVIRKLVQQTLGRGRIEMQVHIEHHGQAPRIVHWDRPLLDGYLQAIHEIQERTGISEPVALAALLELPDLFEVREPETDSDELERTVTTAVTGVLEQIQEMRTREGELLANDLVEKAQQINRLIDAMESRAPQVLEQYHKRLQERLKDLMDGIEISEERLAAEVALFADRCSIDEELVRLRSHIQQLHHSLTLNDAVGRKLDFLIQEMNREANTIGSKANDGQLSRMVVDLKSHLEKMREQIQNIE